MNKYTIAFNHLHNIIEKYVIGQDIPKEKLNKLLDSTIRETYEANKLTKMYNKNDLMKKLIKFKELLRKSDDKDLKIILEKNIELIEGTIIYYNFAISH